MQPKATQLLKLDAARTQFDHLFDKIRVILLLFLDKSKWGKMSQQH